ncbi:MAG: hypothetical protein E7A38_08630, partial [Leclercia adecarboxylata]|nr:hypothetical protein [Leclercia adecarboxylata]MDU1105824.1 hypothetical protein [Enterobacter sp.]
MSSASAIWVLSSYSLYTACGFVWQATMFLLAYFYTDVFGLSAGIMGTL